MANQKISQLNLVTSVLNNDFFVIVRDGINYKVYLNDILNKISSVWTFQGDITLNSDFPLLGDVKNGYVYNIKADVVDNDISKTNTGQTFKNGDIIAWNGVNWTDITGAEYSPLRVLPLSNFPTGGVITTSQIETNDVITINQTTALQTIILQNPTINKKFIIENVGINFFTINNIIINPNFYYEFIFDGVSIKSLGNANTSQNLNHTFQNYYIKTIDGQITTEFFNGSEIVAKTPSANSELVNKNYVDNIQFKEILNLSTGGDIGLAINTVDFYQGFNINQTTTGQTITLPIPTINQYKKDKFIVRNIGTASFVIYTKTLLTNEYAIIKYDGNAYSLDETTSEGHIIKDATTTFTQRANLKFTGSAIVSDNAIDDETVINISGGGGGSNEITIEYAENINAGDVVEFINSGNGKAKKIIEVIAGTGTGIASSGSWTSTNILPYSSSTYTSDILDVDKVIVACATSNNTTVKLLIMTITANSVIIDPLKIYTFNSGVSGICIPRIAVRTNSEFSLLLLHESLGDNPAYVYGGTCDASTNTIIGISPPFNAKAITNHGYWCGTIVKINATQALYAVMSTISNILMETVFTFSGLNTPVSTGYGSDSTNNTYMAYQQIYCGVYYGGTNNKWMFMTSNGFIRTSTINTTNSALTTTGELQLSAGTRSNSFKAKNILGTNKWVCVFWEENYGIRLCVLDTTNNPPVKGTSIFVGYFPTQPVMVDLTLSVNTDPGVFEVLVQASGSTTKQVFTGTFTGMTVSLSKEEFTADTTAGSNLLTNIQNIDWAQVSNTKAITGTNIPANATISSFVNGVSITMNFTATVTASNNAVAIPLNGIPILTTASDSSMTYNPRHSFLSISGSRIVVGSLNSTDGNKLNFNVLQMGDATRINFSNWYGIAQETKNIGESGKIITFGGYSIIHLSLIPGQNYYLQADGTIGLIQTIYKIGKALNPTTLEIFPYSEIGTINLINNTLIIANNKTGWAAIDLSNGTEDGWARGYSEGGLEAIKIKYGLIEIPVRANDPAFVSGIGKYAYYFNSTLQKERFSYNGSAWANKY